MQGHEHGEGMSKSEMGLWSLGQGSQMRVWNGEGQAGSSMQSSENRTKICGWMGYTVGDLRMSWGHGDVWIGVPVRCYTECNTHAATVSSPQLLLLTPGQPDLSATSQGTPSSPPSTQQLVCFPASHWVAYWGTIQHCWPVTRENVTVRQLAYSPPRVNNFAHWVSGTWKH